MDKPAILVVDDEPQTLARLAAGLGQRYDVQGCATGEQAVRAVEENPERFSFAVVDYKLGEGIDGVETTRRIADRSQDTFILVFTNVVGNSKEDRERECQAAFQAGAHRHVERSGDQQEPIQVEKFIHEMDQLRALRERVERYYSGREHVPSLLRHLDLGVDIVDRSFKVWFMNDAMRRIVGYRQPDLPRQRCVSWHGYDLCPCPGCMVKQGFEGSACKGRIFLSPLALRGNRLFYLHVWAQPVIDDQGTVLLADDGLPLAMMETVQDLTSTERLGAMPLRERLGIVANALRERLRPGLRRVQPLDRVAVYADDPTTPEAIALEASAGYPPEPPSHLGSPLDIGLITRWADVRQRAETGGYGTFSEEAGRMDPLDPNTPMTRCIFWPILDGRGKLAALLRASGPSCAESDLALLPPYLDEVRAALEDRRRHLPVSVSPHAEDDLRRIDNRLLTVGAPEAALAYLVTEACRLTHSYLGHLRERRGDQVVLIPLGRHDFDAYERATTVSWPVHHRSSWTVRTILSGAEQVLNDLPAAGREVTEARNALPEAAREVLAPARSFCFEPLVFGGKCIGAVGFHSRRVDNYRTETRWLLHQIARRAALALHDLAAKRLAQERLETIRVETVDFQLHNINNPLGAIWNEIASLQRLAARPPVQAQDLAPVLGRLESACRRIAHIRESFASLLRPACLRTERIQLDAVICEVVAEVLADYRKVLPCFDFDPTLQRLQMDIGVLRPCIEVLVQNALDEFVKGDQDRDPTLTIRTRNATERDRQGLTGLADCLAVEVQDNGPGVPEEVRKMLFQVIGSRKERGLGVGLIRARKLALEAQGNLYLDTAFGEGARFVLVLPYSPQ